MLVGVSFFHNQKVKNFVKLLFFLVSHVISNNNNIYFSLKAHLLSICLFKKYPWLPISLVIFVITFVCFAYGLVFAITYLKTAQYSVHIGFCVYKMAIIFMVFIPCVVVKIAKLKMEHCIMWQAILLHDSRQKMIMYLKEV